MVTINEPKAIDPKERVEARTNALRVARLGIPVL
jgi:hypothetical protein